MDRLSDMVGAGPGRVGPAPGTRPASRSRPGTGSPSRCACSTSTSTSRRSWTSTAARPTTPSTAATSAPPRPRSSRAPGPSCAASQRAGRAAASSTSPGSAGAGEDTHFKHVRRLSARRGAAGRPRALRGPRRGSPGAVMVGHALYPAYDAEQRPATLSPSIIGGLLRGRLGFDGLVLQRRPGDEGARRVGRPARALRDLPSPRAATCSSSATPWRRCPTWWPGWSTRASRSACAEANRRLDTYRQRLLTLRSARDYIQFMRESKPRRAPGEHPPGPGADAGAPGRGVDT